MLIGRFLAAVLRAFRMASPQFCAAHRWPVFSPHFGNRPGQHNLWETKPLKIKGINKELAIRCDNLPQGKYGSMAIRTMHLRHIKPRSFPEPENFLCLF